MTISGHSQVAEMLAPFHGGHYCRQVIQLSLTISGHSQVAEMLTPSMVVNTPGKLYNSL